MDLRIAPVFLTIFVFSSVESTVIQGKYSRVNGTDVIQGPLVGNISTRSVLECSNRCLSSRPCIAYEYKENTVNKINCLLIRINNDNDTNPGDETNFTSFVQVRIYKRDFCSGRNPCRHGGHCVDEADGYRCECPPGLTGSTCVDVDHCVGTPCQNGGACANEADGYRCECPAGFTGANCTDVDYCVASPCENDGTCVNGHGSFTCNCTENYEGPTCQLNCTNPWCTPVPWPPWDNPTFHHSFHTSSALVAHGSPIVTTGKVGSAIRLDRAQSQWVELGDVLGYSCFSSPETCGPNGASLTAWINLIDCPSGSGFISSRLGSGSTGLETLCHPETVNYLLYQGNAGYPMRIPGKPTDWFHLTIVYYGDGNDVDIYYNGERKLTVSPGSSPQESGSGHVVLGRRYVDWDNYYATVGMDELTLWNN